MRKKIDESLTWETAKIKCTNAGGNLASIQSSDENEFIFQLAGKGPAWLGGNDLKTEGEWTWSDGSQWLYKNWGNGEPNNAGGEDCLEIGNLGSKWNDYPCSRKVKAICEKRTTLGEITERSKKAWNSKMFYYTVKTNIMYV